MFTTRNMLDRFNELQTLSLYNNESFQFFFKPSAGIQSVAHVAPEVRSCDRMALDGRGMGAFPMSRFLGHGHRHTICRGARFPGRLRFDQAEDFDGFTWTQRD